MTALVGTRRLDWSLQESVTGMSLTGAALEDRAHWIWPSPSVALGGSVTCSAALSLSKTVIEPAQPEYPGALAVTVTTTVPSNKELSTMVMLKSPLVCPAGMVTVAGTVTLAGLLETRFTTRSTSGAWVTAIWPRPDRVPSPSVAVVGREMDN